MTSTADRAAGADDYPFLNVKFSRKLTPVCGNSFWSVSDHASLVALQPPDQLVECLRALSKVVGFKPTVGFVGSEARPIMQVEKIDGENDGIVCLNDLMLQKIFAEERYALEILTGLLAHEFCHVWQLRSICDIDFNAEVGRNEKRERCFRNLVLSNGSKRYLELHADFVAGWSMARLGLLTTSTFSGYSKQVFSDGDYFPGASDHHGTPRERLNSMADGFLFGSRGEVPGYYAKQTLDNLKHKPDRASFVSAFLVGQTTLAARKY